MKRNQTTKKIDTTKGAFFPYGCSYLKKFATGFISLVNGMALTFGYLINFRKVVTQQYPENRCNLLIADRFRGGVIMVHNENNQHICTGCGICEKSCPNGSISILTTKDISGRRVLGQYIYRLSQCTFCNLCIEACPSNAIMMGKEFELAEYDRRQLTKILHKSDPKTND